MIPACQKIHNQYFNRNVSHGLHQAYNNYSTSIVKVMISGVTTNLAIEVLIVNFLACGNRLNNKLFSSIAKHVIISMKTTQVVLTRVVVTLVSLS